MSFKEWKLKITEFSQQMYSLDVLDSLNDEDLLEMYDNGVSCVAVAQAFGRLLCRSLPPDESKLRDKLLLNMEKFNYQMSMKDKGVHLCH